MTTNVWQEEGPWRRESGELLDNWGWLTDDDLELITGRRPRHAFDDVVVRVPANNTANAHAARVTRDARHRTR